MLRTDVGCSSNAQAVNQRRDVGIIGAHSNTNVHRWMLGWVKGKLCREAHVLVTENGVQVRIKDIKEQMCSFGTLVPAVQPAITENRVGRDGLGCP